MYDSETLGSSATEDSSIVTFDSLFVSKEQRISNTTRKSNRWKCQTSLSCNASQQGRLLTAQVRKFFLFSQFSMITRFCVLWKSDKRKFKDKSFINRWSASQIKHITAKSNSKLRQKILFDIDYQSFAAVASLFVEWFSNRTGTSVHDGARSKNTRKELGRQPGRVLSEMWFSKVHNAVV